MSSEIRDNLPLTSVRAFVFFSSCYSLFSNQNLSVRVCVCLRACLSVEISVGCVSRRHTLKFGDRPGSTENEL